MQLPRFDRLPRSGTVHGLPGAARALFLLRLGRPLLCICREPEDAERLHRDLSFFAAALGAPPPLLVPPREGKLRASRLEALERIASRGATVTVACLEAARAPLGDIAALLAGAIDVRPGTELDPDFLAELLGEMGYRRAVVVADSGELALRRGRLDVFPAAGGQPVRIEHTAGRVAALRSFDVGTQRSLRDLPSLRLLPSREPPSATILVQALPRHLLVADGEPGPEWSGLPVPGLVLADPQRSAASSIRPVECLGVTARERRAAGEPLAALGRRLAALAAERPVLIAGGTPGEAARIRDLLADAGTAVALLEPAALGAHPGRLGLVPAHLSAGFLDEHSGFLALTAAELFGPRPRAHAPAPGGVGALIASLEELAPGDFVVHVEHGVGRFLGVEQTHGQDFLRLEYAGGGRLLLPLERIDLLRRHHAPPEARLRLDTIGGTAWREARGRAHEQVREMAAELLRAAAEREATAGHAFAPDDERHREFAVAFPFEPTPDQLASWEGIREAMERPQPMDWLLCGDAGYGKTEVAMRAAFKAVADGRQVAVIAPTTVLAEQHAGVFAARFAPFPVRVDALTRFTPPGEEGAVLARCAGGETGIVVGTHRLLAPDVAFAALGLVIVDEEQRFGVEHKVRIRQLGAGADVLTLTATPIPRTLSLALAGVRRMSVLETPPEERLAAQTVVARFDAGLVREALARELARGGQAYFVHNRIESIARVGLFLRRLVPGARLGIAHARLPAAALEEVMHAFHAGEIDVLLATAIVGAGLDVPLANTLVVDRADRFGLADLYQLRGRVGRGDRRAFAYFLVPHEDRMTDEARDRLAALTEHSCLGAGFRLALRDLEIRGAGDLLGPEQSGHIAAVGFDLYLEMLQAAVAELRAEAPAAPFEPALELRLEARLPAAWVEAPALRFSLLRRIAAARDAAAVGELRRELADRFGPLPREAGHLLDLAELKVHCRAARVASIVEIGDRRYRVRYAEAAGAPTAALARAAEPRVLLLPEGGFEVDLAKRSWQEIAGALRRLLALR